MLANGGCGRTVHFVYSHAQSSSCARREDTLYYTVLYCSILSCQYIGLPTASKVSVHRMWCRLGRPCQTSMSKQPDAEHCPEWLQRVLVGPSRCLRVTSLVWLAKLRTNKPVTWTYGPGTDCLCVTQLELCLTRSSERDTGLNAQTAGHPRRCCALECLRKLLRRVASVGVLSDRENSTTPF